MPNYVVRYGAMRLLGVFSGMVGGECRRGMQVVARTDRGLETGEVLCEATPETTAKLREPGSGQILREMTPEDRNELTRLRRQAKQRFEVCQQHVDRLSLKMQLVDVEQIFGGERVVVYYLAENRVDFRELVRTLAGEFQTRIEMRQIGVRDEAKLLADYGDCGCAVCCNTHLVEIPPVSMRMAKLQKATLDPTKISGRCGRLKCCLRYEYDDYETAAQAGMTGSAAAIVPQEGIKSNNGPIDEEPLTFDNLAAGVSIGKREETPSENASQEAVHGEDIAERAADNASAAPSSDEATKQTNTQSDNQINDDSNNSVAPDTDKNAG